MIIDEKEPFLSRSSLEKCNDLGIREICRGEMKRAIERLIESELDEFYFRKNNNNTTSEQSENFLL